MSTLAHPYDERFCRTVTEAATLTFPPGRYGRRRDPARRRRQRWMTWVLASIVVLAGIGIAIKLFNQYSLAPYQVRIINVTNLTDTGVTVTFEVTTPAGQPAVCTVAGHTRDGELVGRDQVDVPAGAANETTKRVTYTLKTTKRAVTGEVPGCGPVR